MDDNQLMPPLINHGCSHNKRGVHLQVVADRWWTIRTSDGLSESVTDQNLRSDLEGSAVV